MADSGAIGARTTAIPNRTDLAILTRRVLATAIDYALLAVPPALAGLAVVAVGGGAPAAVPVSQLRLVVAVGLTLPSVAALALGERRGATPGKRLLGLRVEDQKGRPPGYPRALVRLLAKTALPWELGHQAVWDLHNSTHTRGAVLAAAAHIAVGAQLAAALRGSGRTYADHLAGTRVVPARAPGSVSSSG